MSHRTGAGRGFAALLVVAWAAAGPGVWAQHDSVATTLHNLSASGPGEIRAVSETEICKFCHIPHNAVAPVQLWGQRLSGAEYQTPQIRAAGEVRVQAPQPDGSSRLCLSCHDGTVALGEIGGQAARIPMTGASRLGPGRRGFLGTDLTGSHPISFIVPDFDSAAAPSDRDIGLKPLTVIRSDPDVRLDPSGKMQCTTCHDPHRDSYYREARVPRFWVKPTVEEVCLACHEVR